jgi:uncharacterized protein YndB with AHSA1/START domain
MTDPTNRTFQIRLDIAAPRDAVWHAIAEAREIARWFAPKVELEARPGGRLVWTWGDLHRWEQTIEAFEPGRHLRTRYDSSVEDGSGGRRPLFIDFHLEGDAGVTTLRLVHSGFGPEAGFDAEFHGIASGWPVELRSLRLYLEHHRGADRQLAWSTATTDLAPEIAWQRLAEADGLDAGQLVRLREGQPFAVNLAGTEPIRGTALFVPGPREFSGVADNLGKGWFRMHCGQWAGATQVWLWLALYGQPASRAAGFQRAFDGLLRRLFAGGTAAEHLA